ncbi:cytochrome P450 [Catenuloplanes indicus]|uniref:Cytochrome P450 n=1 Tax=Catenuloplanes indicus TaxID=137267 RepID=A0AAE4AWT8_9ACTN|nr:cytochrome P450 [Catenuloplanes indicus]MDQ0363528.1 cytochrome P450 [Catenuloplanes indicus]
MHRIVGEQCEALRRNGSADLSDLSFRVSAGVAAEVIGLTEGRGDLTRRIQRFFDDIPHGTARGLRGMREQSRAIGVNVAFYLRDIRPNVAARRRRRRDDLISHLIDAGRSTMEIMTEIVTYAGAGMVTTREFITVAAWHLFEDDALRTRYPAAGEPERHAILHEILRLEPVVGTISRRTTAPMDLAGRAVPAGTLVDVEVTSVNADPAAAGEQPDTVCPGRDLGAGLSFGDGAHRCPGAHLAIQESDIFLARLFAMPGVRMTRRPEVRIQPMVAAYERTGLRVSVDPA